MRHLIFIPLIAFIGCQSDGNVATYKNYIASWSPDGQQILFYSDRNGNWDIFTIRPDGSGLRQITSSLFNEREPSWHPQKNAYVFSSDSLGNRRIFMRDLDAKKVMLITDGPGEHASPTWAPNGSHLAYLSEQNDNWKLLVKNAKDSTVHVLYEGNNYPGRPTWSPSGKEVMYSIAVNGKETLHLASLEGTTVKTFSPGFNSCGNAALSPDSAYIVFDAHSDDVLDSGDGKWEIFKMNIIDNSIVRLTNNTKDDWGARWSPDGTRILFLGAGLNNTGYELFVMNHDGSGLIQLTDKKK